MWQLPEKSEWIPLRKVNDFGEDEKKLLGFGLTT